MLHRSLCALACSCALLVAGCGGSSDDDDDGTTEPAATDSVPASASDSANGFIGYLKKLVATAPDDTLLLEPVDVSDVKPPHDDTHEPSAI